MGTAIDSEPLFETEDSQGVSIHYNGIVGTSPVAVPSSAVSGQSIVGFLIHNPPSNAHGKYVYISVDGGIGYMLIENKTYIGFSIDGNPTQIHLKGSTSGVNYELILNFSANEVV